jgi:hypothetical protein
MTKNFTTFVAIIIIINIKHYAQTLLDGSFPQSVEVQEPDAYQRDRLGGRVYLLRFGDALDTVRDDVRQFPQECR